MAKLAKVFVQGRSYRGITQNVFRSAQDYVVTDSLKSADIVVWTGGEDINPSLYNENPIPGTIWTDRDAEDLEALSEAYDAKKFLVGICRGAQILNVIPNGGSLWQDVNNHGARNHRIFDCITGTWQMVNSIHHQALRVTDEAQIIAWAQESTRKESEKITWNLKDGYKSEVDKDIEAVWYPKTRSLLVQFHPEFGDKRTTEYFFNLMNKFYWNI